MKSMGMHYIAKKMAKELEKPGPDQDPPDGYEMCYSLTCHMMHIQIANDASYIVRVHKPPYGYLHWIDGKAFFAYAKPDDENILSFAVYL